MKESEKQIESQFSRRGLSETVVVDGQEGEVSQLGVEEDFSTEREESIEESEPGAVQNINEVIRVTLAGEPGKRNEKETTKSGSEKLKRKTYPDTIEGWIEYADQYGFLGKSVSEVQKMEGGEVFKTVFGQWVRKHELKQRQALYDQVYISKSVRWQEVALRGIDGWVEYADQHGFLGKSVIEVENKDGGKAFISAFERWLKGRPKEQRRELRNLVFASLKKESIDWQEIGERGIDGWVEYADQHGFLGKTVDELKEIKGGEAFSRAFIGWLGSQKLTEKQRLKFRNRVLGFSEKKMKEILLQKIVAKGIEGWVEYANELGFLGMSVKQVTEKMNGGKAFYLAFLRWLKTQPQEQRQELRDRVFAPDARFEKVALWRKLEQDLTDEVKRKNFDRYLEIFGGSKLVDIFYAVMPEYQSLPPKEVRKILPEYLGEVSRQGQGFSLKDLDSEVMVKILQIKDFKEVFLLNVKQECLQFYQKQLKAGQLKTDNDVLDRLGQILDDLGKLASKDKSGKLNEFYKEIHDTSLDYYYRLEALEQNKPPDLVDFLGQTESQRGFPDFGQRINVQEFLDQKRIVVADEMGLGKTASAILAKEYLQQQKGERVPALILSPHAALSQWQAHLKQRESPEQTKACFVFDPDNPERGRREVLVLKRTSPASDWEQLAAGNFDYVLVSHEVLADPALVEQLTATPFDVLITDEVHLLKNITKGKQADNFLNLVTSQKQRGKGYFIGLSGTPIPNKIGDIAVHLRTLYPELYKPVAGQSQSQFNASLVRKILETDQLDLRALLMSRMQMRELKESVEMPEVQEREVTVKLSGAERLIYETIVDDDELNASEKIMALRKFILNPETFGVLPETTLSKITALQNELNNFFATGKNKIVVFVSDLIEGVLESDQEGKDIKQKLNLPPDVKVQTITGKTDKDEREQIQGDFQSTNEKEVLFLSSTTSGTGVDLSAGQAVIFYNEPWTMSLKRQCLARVYRPGQVGKVESATLVTPDTIEAGIADYIRRKENIINKLLHGIPLSEIESKLLKESEDVGDKEKTDRLGRGVEQYLISDYSVLGKMFSANREIGEAKFAKFVSEYGADYAQLYQKSLEYSYQANSNRVLGTMLNNLVTGRGQNVSELKIVDLASGPKMLQRHLDEQLARQTRSLDLNGHHFPPEETDVDIAHLTNLPYDDDSLDYLSMSFALHYSAYNPSHEQWERLKIFQEMARVLKVGGVAMINQIHSLAIKHPGAFEQVMAGLGLKVRKDWSGRVSSTARRVSSTGKGERNDFVSELLVLEKIQTSDPVELEELVAQLEEQELDLSAADTGAKKVLDGLKLGRGSPKRLRDQRQIIEKFKLHALDGTISSQVPITYNQADQFLKGEQDQALIVYQELLAKHGKLEEIPSNELQQAGMIRFKLKETWHLVKKVAGEKIGLVLV